MNIETQNPEPLAMSLEPGSEDAAVAAFALRSKQATEPEKSATEPEPENEDTEADEDQSDPDKGDPETDDEPTAELVEVEIDGKTYQVPPEVHKATLRQADYSRKMNEVGTVEKTAKARLEQAEKLIDGAEKFAEALAEVNAAKAQIARFEKVDWTLLRTTNPAEYAATRADLQAYISDHEAAVRKAQGVDSELSEVRAKDQATKRGAMLQDLQKNLKGWGDELGAKITRYALDQGYTAEELQNFADAKMVIALDKARKYDALQNDKAGLKAKAQDAPRVVKPGAPRRVDATAESQTRFHKTRSDDDAVALLQARRRK